MLLPLLLLLLLPLLLLLHLLRVPRVERPEKHENKFRACSQVHAAFSPGENTGGDQLARLRVMVQHELVVVAGATSFDHQGTIHI